MCVHTHAHVYVHLLCVLGVLCFTGIGFFSVMVAVEDRSFPSGTVSP